MKLQRPVEIPSSKIIAIEFEMYTRKFSNDEFKKSKEFINGLTNYNLVIKENVIAEQSEFIDHLDYNGDRTLVHFKYFPPGGVILFKVVLNETSSKAVKLVRNSISELIRSQIKKSNKSYERFVKFYKK